MTAIRNTSGDEEQITIRLTLRNLTLNHGLVLRWLVLRKNAASQKDRRQIWLDEELEKWPPVWGVWCIRHTRSTTHWGPQGPSLSQVHTTGHSYQPRVAPCVPFCTVRSRLFHTASISMFPRHPRTAHNAFSPHTHHARGPSRRLLSYRCPSTWGWARRALRQHVGNLLSVRWKIHSSPSLPPQPSLFVHIPLYPPFFTILGSAARFRNNA